MAGSLSFLGMGLDSNLVEAVPSDNPKGYWEPVQVVKINDDIFSVFNMHYMDFSSFPNGWMNHEAMVPIRHRIKTWFKQSFSDESLIVVKDPRLCRTLLLWVDVLEQLQVEIKYIHVFRHPMEVVGSLCSRDSSFPVVKGLCVWLAHVLGSFRSPAGNHVIVSYDALMADPIATLNRSGEELNLEWPVALEVAAEHLRSFLEPALVHQYFQGDIPYPPLNKLVQSVFDCLNSYDLQSLNNDFYTSIENYQAVFQEFESLFEPMLREYKDKHEQEKKNTQEQVAYRDTLLVELNGQLEAEKVRRTGCISGYPAG